MTRFLGTAAIAVCLMSGAAFAQQAPLAPGNVDGAADNQITNSTSNYESTDEKAMYDNTYLRDFFTDDSMQTMKSGDEIKATFLSMGADDQASMKAACDRVNNDRGSYGTITKGLCAQVMAM
jgi:hypothetical protein